MVTMRTVIMNITPIKNFYKKTGWLIFIYPSLFILSHLLKPLEFAAFDLNIYPVFLFLALSRLAFYATTLPYQSLIIEVWPYQINEYDTGFILLYSLIALAVNTSIVWWVVVLIKKYTKKT